MREQALIHARIDLFLRLFRKGSEDDLVRWVQPTDCQGLESAGCTHPTGPSPRKMRAGARAGPRPEVGQAFQPDSVRRRSRPGPIGVRLESLTYFPARPIPTPLGLSIHYYRQTQLLEQTPRRSQSRETLPSPDWAGENVPGAPVSPSSPLNRTVRFQVEAGPGNAEKCMHCHLGHDRPDDSVDRIVKEPGSVGPLLTACIRFAKTVTRFSKPYSRLYPKY
jgi:hypothetical protein